MAVCDLCKGTGRLIKPWYDTTGAMMGMTGDICFMCDGKGTIGESMTNEEYLRSLNTEQLAEWIAKIVDCDCCPVKRKFCDDNPCKIRFVKWLKQPHKG